MKFPRMRLQKVRLSGNYEGIPLHEFMALAHLTLPVEEALKEDTNCTHWNPIFNSADPDRNDGKRERGMARYTHMKTFLVDHREKPEF